MRLQTTSNLRKIFLPYLLVLFSQIAFSNVSTNFLVGEIQGNIWLDSNSNNVRDQGDSSIEGVRVDLFLSSGTLIQFQNTDSNGNFSFNNIPSGEYFIKVENRNGLQLVSQNVGNEFEDSDFASNGISDFFIHNAAGTSTIDGGFESSLYVISDNIIESCKGVPIEIELMPMSAGDNITYSWQHDPQLTGNIANILVDETKIYYATITDEWNMPVIKEILVKVREGVGEEFCTIIDPFNEGETSSFNMNVSGASPGPINSLEAVPSAFGGFRDITFELLDGNNTSSIDIDYSNQTFSISNGNGSRTKTSICYDGNNTGTTMSLESFDYLKLLDILIDQGTLEANVLLTDMNGNVASYLTEIESQGFNNIFKEEIYFEHFSNIANLQLDKVEKVCFELITMNSAIDFEVKFTSFCGEKSCKPYASDDVFICVGESATIQGITECTDNVIFNWDNGLGFGKEKIVSPINNTTYTVTVFDQNGCSSTAQTTVMVNNRPSFNLDAEKEIICEGESFSINANHTSNSGPYQYFWNNDKYTNEINVSPSVDTTYSLVVFDSNGCSAEQSVAITVNPAPQVNIITTPSNCLNYNGTVTTTISGGSPPFSLSWDNGQTGSNLNSLPPGIIELTITDSKQCSFIESVTIPSLNCAEIGDYVWHDLNVNGIQENDEPAIENVQVILKDVNQNHLDTTYTNQDGYYLFTPLDAGMYYVQFETPTDFIRTIQNTSASSELDSDADPLTGMSKKVTLVQGQKDLTIDAGFYQLGKIGNYVWHDTNINGVQENGEVGLENVQVTLYDCDDNEIQNVKTDAFGKYQFCDLEPGEYYVHFDNVPGFSTSPMDQSNDSADSDRNPIDGNTPCTTLESGEIDTLIDAGYYELAKLGNFVWLDENINGIQDTFELPIPNLEVKLYSCDTILLDSIVTDSNGAYYFCDLEPGNYQLFFPTIDNHNYTITTDTLDAALNSDNINAGFSSCIELDEGEKDSLTDAGYYELASLGDYVWLDKNYNGSQDLDESGLENIEIFLLDCQNEKIDSTLTDVNGYYLFDKLEPDDYKIYVDKIPEYFITKNDFVNDSLDNDIDSLTQMSSCVELESGEDYRDLDVGFYTYSKIGDFVWFDTNANGIQDPGENGEPGIEVDLINCTSGATTTKITDANGHYCFDKLLSDDYKLVFHVDLPLVLVDKNQGGNNTKDSDADVLTGEVDCFNLGISEEDLSIDAGVYTCSKIGDFVWYDFINNNIQDPSENGLNGMTIKLYRLENGQWNFVDETESGPKPNSNSDDGWWEFCVPPGQYYIKVEESFGLEPVIPHQGNNEALDSDIDGAFGPWTSNIITVVGSVDNLDVGAGFTPSQNNSPNFDATIESLMGEHLLKWNSTNEGEAQQYKLYKKAPSKVDYNDLEEIDTKNEVLNEYELFDDQIAANGMYQYRIEMLNGLDQILDQEELSILVNADFELLMYPNPVKNELNLVFKASEGDDIVLEIFDNKGASMNKTVKVECLETKIYDVEIDVADLPSAVYHLVYTQNDSVLSEKFIKIH